MKHFWLCFLTLIVITGHSAMAFNVSDLLAKTNQERTNAKLPPLTLNMKLVEAASVKANDIVKQNYWSHVSPQGVTPPQLLHQVGYNFRVMGENLAEDYGSADSVIAAWMNSSGHRRNLLNPKFCDVGFASVGNVTVQEFGCQQKI